MDMPMAPWSSFIGERISCQLVFGIFYRTRGFLMSAGGVELSVFVLSLSIIFTFSIKQSQHILEEGVNALANVFHLILKSTCWSLSSHKYPIRLVLTL